MFCDKLTKQVEVSSFAPIVQIAGGKIGGIKKGGIYIFRGIPYVEAKRFHLPKRVSPWNGVKPAVNYGYVCPEFITPVAADQQMNPHYYMPQDENCQYLNIWTPSLDNRAGKPVMIWMHGGAWTTGSGVEQYAYDGEELACFGDVVVVSFNHRLNCLGGLDLSSFGEEYRFSGYCALSDILYLLQWVKENISAFGGDADNVMIFGQSGGVAKILFTMQCPFADGLYHKAAIDSGGIKEQIVPDGWTGKQLAVRMGELTAQMLGLTKNTIRQIEKVAYWDLAAAAMDAEKILQKESGLEAPYRWEPVPDGQLVIGSTLKEGFRKETVNIPMMIGNVFGETRSNLVCNGYTKERGKNSLNEEEVQAYAKNEFGEYAQELLAEFRKVYPENALADVLYMDHAERDGQLELVKKRVNMGADTWNWLFKRESPLNGGTVAWHCSEIPFIFHNASYIEAAFEPGVSKELEDTMAGAWVAFARTGDPSMCGKTSDWRKVTKEHIETMVFDKESKNRTDHDIRLRQLLKKAYERRGE